MCGRYALTVEPSVLAALFALREGTAFDPRFNLAPSQEAPVVFMEGGQRVVRALRWGLIPSWSKDAKIAYRTINARSETAATKPAFRAAFKRRRCIVPASWFYEWQREGSQKVPFRIQRKDRALLAFAGLHEQWDGAGSEPPRSTFTILTTDANADLAELHDRMPCILAADDFDRWLTPQVDDAEATARLLQPSVPGALELDRVSTKLNHVKNEGAALMTPDTLF